MNYNDDEQVDNIEKIPYDDEPISRNRGGNFYVRPETVNKEKPKVQKNSRFGIIFLAIIPIVLVVAFVFLYSQFLEVKDSKNNYDINITTENSNLAYASTKGYLSTVCVAANNANTINSEETFFSSAYSLGSGVIYSLDKDSGSLYCITNYHVVASTSTKNYFGYYWILLCDSDTPLRATCVGGSYLYDIAVLKVENSNEIKNSSCTEAVVADSSGVSVGNECLAIGNSMGQSLRVSNGIISVEEVLMQKTTTFVSMFISFTAAVNSGNSGGGLYNDEGNLIGIVNAKFADTDEDTGTLTYGEVVHGMFYAIPGNIALAVAKNIVRNNGHLRKANIGLNYGISYDYTDKKVIYVEENVIQTQYKLIMLATGNGFYTNDVFKSLSYTFGGQTITDGIDHIASIENHILNWSVGDVITFVVETAGVERTVTVTVGSTSAVE